MFVIDTTAYHLGQYSLHFLLLKSSPDCFNEPSVGVKIVLRYRFQVARIQTETVLVSRFIFITDAFKAEMRNSQNKRQTNERTHSKTEIKTKICKNNFSSGLYLWPFALG